MNNLYKRPMFRKGGSAEGGITSGLGRPGYAENGSVEELTTKEKLTYNLWVLNLANKILMIF